MPSLPPRTKKHGTPKWSFGQHGRRKRDREHRKATKSTARCTTMSVPVFRKIGLQEARGLSSTPPSRHFFRVARSDFRHRPYQARSKVASIATLPVAVQPSNEDETDDDETDEDETDEDETDADDVYPDIEIKLGRKFLGFLKKNQDLVKAYNSRLAYQELDLSQQYLRFTRENQNLIQAYISRLTH
ncbi:MAG: hypothetical protein Q9195_003319 [Heterodermia aff. obscurata]